MVRTQVQKPLPGPRKSKRGESKGDVRRGATAGGVMYKGECVRVVTGRRSEEMTQSNTFSRRGSEVPLESQKG